MNDGMVGEEEPATHEILRVDVGAQPQQFPTVVRLARPCRKVKGALQVLASTGT